MSEHMRQDGTPSNKINKMKDIFQSAMVSKFTSMLAEHLDSHEKLNEAVSTMIAASQGLHGKKIHPELNVSAAVKTTKEPNKYYEASETDSKPPEKKSKKRKKNTEKAKDQNEQVQRDHSHTAIDLHASEVQTNVLHPIIMNPAMIRHKEAKIRKQKRVSNSWRWNINPEAFDDEDIPHHFKKTSDLFAYHALPIVERKLGPTAKWNVIREKLRLFCSICRMLSLRNGWTASKSSGRATLLCLTVDLKIPSSTVWNQGLPPQH